MVSPCPPAPSEGESTMPSPSWNNDRKPSGLRRPRTPNSRPHPDEQAINSPTKHDDHTYDAQATSSLPMSPSRAPEHPIADAGSQRHHRNGTHRRRRTLSPSATGAHTGFPHTNGTTEHAAQHGRNGASWGGNGVYNKSHAGASSPRARNMNGDAKTDGRVYDQAFGLVFEHSEDHNSASHRTSLVDVFEGPEVAASLQHWSEEAAPSSPGRNIDKERERVGENDNERVLKLSPAKIQELTASPQSIPYRAVPENSTASRRVVSDGSQGLLQSPDLVSEEEGQEVKLPENIMPKRRSSKEPIDGAVIKHSSTSSRSRPSGARTFSTPTTSRRQTLSGTNERLAQTWASRSKHDRLTMSRDGAAAESKHLSPSPQLNEPGALPSPMLPAIPLPPLSVPTYLQLELASGRPSPLYIHRSVMTDFPYESSRVKLERLMNFLMLPPAVEQVLWFGILACLDAWLYSFTILPLRFLKALYILLESWVLNLGAECRFVWGFVIKGIGRVWRRQARPSIDASSQEPGRTGEREGRSRAASGRQDGAVAAERDARNRSMPEQRRRHRSDTKHQHRRQKSMPSALLPDDKADILKGLLMITTCCVLMFFDASRMYHWIRGQAAIKLYVIYNVLEVSDRLFAAIGQDVLECLFSREALERRPDGRSKVFRPFGLFLLALAYTVIHATALFFQVMTLNVAVNSYSNALITLLLSNQFVEIKSTVFKKFEKENLFQLTCADVVERFQLWLMLTIIASRNIVETGAFNFVGSLGSSFSGNPSASSNSTPLSTPPRTASSILPQSFTIVPSSIIASISNVNSFLPTLAQVLGPFLVVLGSEMLVDWLKHAYINKFNNTRPAIYGRFLDILAKDYYTNAFGDQNLTRRLGLPVIPLSCLFFRVSVQTYQMFLAALLPHQPSSTAVDSTSLTSIHSNFVPSTIPSPTPITLRTIVPVSVAHVSSFFRQLLANAMPSPAQSVYIFTVVLILTGFVLLLVLKLLLGMLLLAFARSRYKAMKAREGEQPTSSTASESASSNSNNHIIPATATAPASRPPKEFAVEGSRRVGGWGVVEVSDDHRRWIYVDDPESLRRLKAKEEKDKNTKEDFNMDHVQRYEMVAKRIW